MKRIGWLLCAVAGIAIAAAVEKPRMGPSDEDIAKAEIKSAKVAGNVWMVQGIGGNIGVLAGDDGLLVIDSQYAPLFPKLKAAFEKISPKPPRFLFNTHWHGDHTGGNLQMAEAGALIIAHDNVRKRLSTEQNLALWGGIKIPPSPEKARPVITLDEELELHLDGEDVRVLYVPAAHTDGDCLVQFSKADVIHSGDVFINGGFPVIDSSSGGTLDGYLKAQEKLLALAGPKTKIIPGHGALADKAALQSTHEGIQKVRDRIVALIDQGKALPDIKAAKPTAEFDAKWGNGPIKPDMFVEMAFHAYAAQKKGAK